MRKKIIVGNWKMNKTKQEAKEFCLAFNNFTKEIKNKDILIGVAPSYLALETLKKESKGLLLFAQNCHAKESGAFTGEVSLPMLKEVGVYGSLVGHSERRKYQYESSVDCNEKLQALFKNNLTPIYCVGETLEEYETNKGKDVIEKQLKEGLEGIGGNDVSKMVIAYEPVWSIGTGKNASKEIAQDICNYIRKNIEDWYGKKVADQVLIQYGGSVKPENVKSYLSCPDIDGVLVGGASLDAKQFEQLIKNIIE